VLRCFGYGPHPHRGDCFSRRPSFSAGGSHTHFELRHLALLMLCLVSLMDLTIVHMVLVYERTPLCLDALVTTHILIVVIVSHVGLVFLLEGLTLTLSRDI
jgi:hypothetical protein